MSLTEQLSVPFDKRFINRVDKGSHTEDYVNHAVVTNRLNMVLGVDGWSFHIRDIGTFTDKDGGLHVAHILAEITVYGEGASISTREEIGVPGRVSKYHDEIKAATSDALKRCAMRFGVAIQLWHDIEPSTGAGTEEPSAPVESPWSGDSDPSGDGGQRGPGEGIGEGPTPGLAPTFDELVALAGSTSKAREAINTASAAEYTPRSVREATDLERTAARELLLGL